MLQWNCQSKHDLNWLFEKKFIIRLLTVITENALFRQLFICVGKLRRHSDCFVWKGQKRNFINFFYIFDYSKSRKSTAFLFFVEFMKRHTIHLVYSENNCKEKELLISKNKNTMPAYNFLQFFVQLFTKHNLRKVFLKTTKTMAITTHQLRLHIGSETFTLLLCSIYYCLNIYLF